MTTATELLRRALDYIDQYDSKGLEVYEEIEAFLAAEPEAEPVAWRDHVEARIRGWRRSQMNSDGDRISVSDLMYPEEIDDLVDYVCDEYTSPEPARKPITDVEIMRELPMPECSGAYYDGFCDGVDFAEKHHGIGGDDE